jgi:hypothetical protein
MNEQLSVGKRRMYIHTPGWHTFYFITLMSITVARSCRCDCGQRWYCGRSCRLRWWRCAGFFVLPVCLQIVRSAIVAWKAAVRIMFKNNCWVSQNFSLHLFMPCKLNSSQRFMSDFVASLLDSLLSFFYCGTPKPSFGHFVHIQGQAHVGLF